MTAIELNKSVQQQIQEAQLHVINGLTENIIKGNKTDWVLLKLKIPITLREWLDTNKRINNISYSAFIRTAILHNMKSRLIFLKLINGEQLTKKDLETIQDIVNKNR